MVWAVRVEDSAWVSMPVILASLYAPIWEFRRFMIGGSTLLTPLIMLRRLKGDQAPFSASSTSDLTSCRLIWSTPKYCRDSRLSVSSSSSSFFISWAVVPCMAAA